MGSRQPFKQTLAAALAGVAARGTAALPPVARVPRKPPGGSRWREGESVAGRAPEPPSPFRRDTELARLEAALFLAREPLSPRRLAKLAGLADGTRARSLLRDLRRVQEASGSAVRVEQIAGGFQLLTRSAFGPWVRRFVEPPAAGRLTVAALETLAIVAYRQPVTRAELESIRGVGSEELLRQLLEKDLVAVAGKAEEIGRPNVYVTTRRFLASFGLARLEDLPPVEGPSAGPESPASGSDS